MATLYGIKNCDTMKKALKWLDESGASYEFHDYKKQGTPRDIIAEAIKQCGWENLINRRGTTWRKLDEAVKNTMDENTALDIAIDNPSIIKRPLLSLDGKMTLGFKEDEYARFFKP